MNLSNLTSFMSTTAYVHSSIKVFGHFYSLQEVVHDLKVISDKSKPHRPFC